MGADVACDAISNLWSNSSDRAFTRWGVYEHPIGTSESLNQRSYDFSQQSAIIRKIFELSRDDKPWPDLQFQWKFKGLY